MRFLSQNKKVLLTSVSIFIVSFSVLLFFLDNKGENLDFGHSDVLNYSEEHGASDVSSDKKEDINIKKEAKTEYRRNFRIPKHVENRLPREIKTSEDVVDEYLKEANVEKDNNWFATDSTGIIVDGSDKFFEMIGATSNEVVGQLIYSYINKDDISELIMHNSELIQDGESFHGLGPFRFDGNEDDEVDENGLLKEDDGQITMFDAVPIRNEHKDKVENIIYSVKDISGVVGDMVDNKVKKEMNKKVKDKKIEDQIDDNAVLEEIDSQDVEIEDIVYEDVEIGLFASEDNKIKELVYEDVETQIIETEEVNKEYKNEDEDVNENEIVVKNKDKKEKNISLKEEKVKMDDKDKDVEKDLKHTDIADKDEREKGRNVFPKG